MESDAPVVVTGEGRVLKAGADAVNVPLRFELRETDFTAMLTGAPSPMTANYRDLLTVVVDQSRVMVDIGGTRLLAERLGAGLGSLVGTLRDRRARQLLTDRLIDLPSDAAIELAEYQTGAEHAVAQVAYHPWGVALIPLDERLPWRLLRRSDIAAVNLDVAGGQLTAEIAPRPGAPDARSVQLLGLGAAAQREGDRLHGLRQAALSDAAAIVGALIPDAPAADRARVSALLVDGRPVSRENLGTAWTLVERSVLTDPTYAASYSALASRAGGGQAKTWISLSPKRPGSPEEHMCWFFVALPGNLIAFELVSEGAHATYLFRARDSVEAAVFDVSESLIDTRFLREPIYLTQPALEDAIYMRYRLAIAALPSLRAARARFVGRLIHSDEESWARSLDNAIAWNTAETDDSARWPGTSDEPEGA